MSEQLLCGFWGGLCKAISSLEHPDIKRVKRDWLKGNVDEIKLLPKEQALSEFKKGWDSKIREMKTAEGVLNQTGEHDDTRSNTPNREASE